ncbi:zeta toxin family protein [Candidatus Magnetaquicoccus inordinatus]|uniref:zeta toxin family protein n=1 Tax=Candidatus Magnetaquicoccus inordinatus TaxID=2496818 RepID=UPI00102B6BD3|nr:zeta toxin family protein [Candidatus Magnetaquicoccus inordinatus]
MTTSSQPICRIISGPNGAGKTTFALTYLPEVAHCRTFINADLIAAGLSPLAPEQQLLSASRLFLGEIEQCIQSRRDFAFETTLSGRGHLQLIRRMKADGWRVELLYLALPNVEMSLLRVSERVAHGGHSIPAADIQRRFPRSLGNFLGEYAELVDYARLFLNSEKEPQLIMIQQGKERTILQPEIFEHLIREAKG